MTKSSVVIVSPAARDANNGNARTAQRWAAMLESHHCVRVVQTWPDGRDADAMVALHARRSAPSVQAWARAHPDRPLVVVLTGTDLYQDLAWSAEARHSLEAAHRLVVLQEAGLDGLPAGARSKARVIYQSTSHLPACADKPDGALQAVMVGHLRAVKAPEVLFAAARALHADECIRIAHIGSDEGEPALGAAARETQRACPHYEWLGALPHDETRERIRRAHVLVHTSVLEGGAHVIMEAASSGTPVLASRVSGNVGMLGPDYGGYFPVNDADALAALLRECRRTQASAGGLLARLAAQCGARARLFEPASEQEALLRLLDFSRRT